MNGQRETVETSSWSDRELLLRTYYQSCETNGRLRTLEGRTQSLESTVYGDEHRAIEGLTVQAHENSLYRERAKTVVKLAAWAAGLIGTMLTTILVLILEHVI